MALVESPCVTTPGAPPGRVDPLKLSTRATLTFLPDQPLSHMAATPVSVVATGSDVVGICVDVGQ